MTVEELLMRFPMIPHALRAEPILERFGAAFDEELRAAQKPSPCSAGQQTPSNHLYMKLIGPLELVAIGLATKDRAVTDMTSLIERAESDRDALRAELIPADASRRPGGCAG